MLSAASCLGHIQIPHDEVKEALRQASVDAVLVPGGCKKKI